MTVGRSRIKKPKHPLPTRVYQKRGKYWFVPKPADVERFGGKTWIDLGTSYRNAMIAHNNITSINNGTLAEVWRRYGLKVLPDNAEPTQNNKKKYWGRLEQVFGHCHPDDVIPADIYDYLDIRREDGAGVVGNREIALLSHMYTKAIRWRMAIINPCLRVERNPENLNEKMYVTDQLLSAWLKFAPRKMALYTELEFMVGHRCSDVLHIKLSQLQDDGIHQTASKTRRSSVTPWTDDLRAVIKELKALRVNKNGAKFFSDYLICTRHGKGYTKSGFDSNWQKEMRKFVAAGHQRFAASDMRAKHASDLDSDGGDATRNLQHSNRQVTDRHYLRRPTVLVSLKRPKY